jgi:hypothetical protein
MKKNSTVPVFKDSFTELSKIYQSFPLPNSLVWPGI